MSAVPAVFTKTSIVLELVYDVTEKPGKFIIFAHTPSRKLTDQPSGWIKRLV